MSSNSSLRINRQNQDFISLVPVFGVFILIYFIRPIDQYIAEEDLNGAPNRFSFRKLPKTSFFFFLIFW